VDPNLSAVRPLAPATSTVKALVRTARLEAHIGTVVGAVAATIGAAWSELEDGRLTLLTKGQGGQLIYELYQLRQLLLTSFPNFDDLARQCGIQTLMECAIAPEAAKFLVDEAMSLLAKVVAHQSH
jgi:hypothetical protein